MAEREYRDIEGNVVTMASKDDKGSKPPYRDYTLEVCHVCGEKFWQSPLSSISDAILHRKPICLECADNYEGKPK